MITPAELAARMHELVARGLIVRRPDEAGRRRQLLEITEAGSAPLEGPIGPNSTNGCMPRCATT